MAAVENVANRQWSIDAVSWTAITVPHECNNVFFKATDAWKWRTRSTDATTEDQGLQFEISSPATIGHRFKSGQTVLYAQSVSGTVTVIVRSEQ